MKVTTGEGKRTSEDEQVLEIAILGELRVVTLEDNAFEEFDELVGEVGIHESLDSGGDEFSLASLWQHCLHDLVDQRAAVLIRWLQHVRPQLRALLLNEVASLLLEH